MKVYVVVEIDGCEGAFMGVRLVTTDWEEALAKEKELETSIDFGMIEIVEDANV